MNIFFSIDDKFVIYCTVTMSSILKNARESDTLNFYVISKGLSSENKDKFYKLQKIRKFNINFPIVDDNIFNKFPTPDYISSSSSLYRYLIPNLEPAIDKALYLDSDIIVRHSLHSVFDENLGANYIAGCEDFDHYLSIKKTKAGIGGPDEVYLNSGVLLINCKKWREDNLFEKLIVKTQQLNKKCLEQTDQDAINMVCKGKKLVLEPKYNLLSCYDNAVLYTSYTNEQMEKAEKDPTIVHYSGSVKPWHYTNFPLNNWAWEYFFYAKLTDFKINWLRLFCCNKHMKKFFLKIKKMLF